MQRRDFLFAASAAGFAVSSAAPSAHAEAIIEMIYVGGRDCPYCTMWRNKYEAAWRASPEFRCVTWIEIDPPHLREAYQERYWQGPLQETLEQIPRKTGTPRFLLLKDGKVVANQLGVDKWPAMLDRLHDILGWGNGGRA